MSKKTWIWLLTFLSIILLILISYVIVKGGQVTLKISWRHYAEYGSPDTEFIKVYELAPDTTIIDFIGQTSVQNDSLIFSIKKENKIYYFGVTAIDSTGNEELTFTNNIGIWDGLVPILPQDIKIQKLDN